MCSETYFSYNGLLLQSSLKLKYNTVLSVPVVLTRRAKHFFFFIVKNSNRQIAQYFFWKENVVNTGGLFEWNIFKNTFFSFRMTILPKTFLDENILKTAIFIQVEYNFYCYFFFSHLLRVSMSSRAPQLHADYPERLWFSFVVDPYGY